MKQASSSIPYPVSIEIQPTSACNLRCKWCSYWKRNQFDINQKQYLNSEIIDKIIRFCQTSSVKSVYLAGGGEPCAYPFIQNLVHRLSQLPLSLALITNGNLVAKKLLSEVKHFKYLQISIISITEAGYACATGSKKGFKMMTDLPRIIKETHVDSMPLIGGMYVLTEWNYQDTFKVIDFCRIHHFDYCSFRIAIDFEDRGVALSQKTYEFLKTGLKSHFVDSRYTNLEKVLATYFNDPSQGTECVNIKYGLFATIDTPGEVYLCVPDVGKKQYCIGSLRDQSFEEIWNSPAHHALIKQLTTRYDNKGCHTACRAHGYNCAARC